MTPQDLQLKYELDCDDEAATARLAALREAAASGATDTPRAQRLAAQMFKTVRDLLEEAMSVKTRGTGGAYKSWMRRLGPDKAAAIAIRECISRCAKPTHYDTSMYPSAQLLTLKIGKLYEMEVRIMEAEEVNPMYMQKIHDQVKENATSNVEHLRKLYNVAYTRVMKGELDSQVSDSEAAQIGKFGVDACWQAGLIRIVEQAKSTMTHYAIDEEIAAFLSGFDETDVYNVVDRGTGAMLCEPNPWTNANDGGYLSVRRKAQFPLLNVGKLRKSERKRLRETFTAEKMPLVFECANYLQSRRFTIHRPTLDAITRLWQAGGGALGVPTRNKPPKPQFPFPETWVKADATPEELAAFQSWKRVTTEYYTNMKSWRGHTQEIGGFIKIGHRIQGEMWFPVFADSRGRWYYHGTPNPQGSDISKAVLHFAEKKPLGKRGLFWLKVHIANSLGFDKERMQVRADYVDSIWSRLEAALDAPEDCPEVWGKDAPWCAYSAAYELREAYRSGRPEAHETGIIVHMDATCSGLQHFSAMLRDEVGGKYVNLYDDERTGPKQDIYTKVANEAVITMAGAATPAQQYWVDNGITRSDAKHPVMTYVYGATLRGCSEDLGMVVDSVRNDSDAEKGERNVDISMAGAKALFGGIEATVPAAANGMRWLQQAIKTAPRGRLEWTAPTGFKVQHDYQKLEEVRVRINSCGVTMIMFREFTDETNAHSMRNAISPNFVHALDASHLTFTALGMKRLGLDFVGIHDSFGTHACDVDVLHKVIRTEFVGMYTHFDVLENFLWEIGGVGEMPKKGKLDLNRVLDSEFFFS